MVIEQLCRYFRARTALCLTSSAREAHLTSVGCQAIKRRRGLGKNRAFLRPESQGERILVWVLLLTETHD